MKSPIFQVVRRQNRDSAELRTDVRELSSTTLATADFECTGSRSRIRIQEDTSVGVAMGASHVAEPTSASPPRRDERGESRRRRWEDERAGEGAKERACERDTWRRERSRDWLSRSEKPAWLLDRPALRSVLHCAPCEAELSRFTLPLSLAANRRFVRVRPFDRDPVRVPVGKRTAVHQEIVSDNSVFAPIYVSERADGRKEGSRESRATMCKRKPLQVLQDA